MRTAGQRIAMRMGGTDQFNSLVHSVTSQEDIASLARKQGFDEEWLVTAPPQRKKDDGNQAGQRQHAASSSWSPTGEGAVATPAAAAAAAAPRPGS